MKNSFYPLTKFIHSIARQLNNTIHSYKSASRKRLGNVASADVSFEIESNSKEAKSVIQSFIIEDGIINCKDIKEAFEAFLQADDTRKFVLDQLKTSLDNLCKRIIESVEDGYRAKAIDLEDGLRDLAKFFCLGKLNRFFAHQALPLYSWVLKKLNLSQPKEEEEWPNCDKEDRINMLTVCLELILTKVLEKLGKVRFVPAEMSPLELQQELKKGVAEIFAVRSIDRVASDTDFLKDKLKSVIKFSSQAIKTHNPHYDLSRLASLDHENGFPECMKMRPLDENLEIPLDPPDPESIITYVMQVLTSKKHDPVREVEKKLKLEKHALDPPQGVDAEEWVKALLTVLSDEDHFKIPLEDTYKLVVDKESVISDAKQRLFPFQRSRVECRIVEKSTILEKEIQVERRTELENVLEVAMSGETRKYLESVCVSFTDFHTQLAPIFIPVTHPGPEKERKGNFSLEENYWNPSEVEIFNEEDIETAKDRVATAEEDKKKSKLEFNIFLVVEKQHLDIIKSSIKEQESPVDRKVNVYYVMLPQSGRGMGVTMAIIKSLAECFKFDAYWRIDDDLKFMYQFVERDHRWHKCSFGRGLLFAQRAFHQRRQEVLKPLSCEDVEKLADELEESWPSFASKSRHKARRLLYNDNELEKVKKNPGLLHSPFTSEIISEDCGSVEDTEKLRKFEKEFVAKCRDLIFQSSADRIAGVSLSHLTTRKADIMGSFPSAHFRPLKQVSQVNQMNQVVLFNASALQGINYVSDEVIFSDEENQISNKEKSTKPYWGVKNSEKFFGSALQVNGIIGFQVICVNHVHEKRLKDVFPTPTEK